MHAQWCNTDFQKLSKNLIIQSKSVIIHYVFRKKWKSHKNADTHNYHNELHWIQNINRTYGCVMITTTLGL